MVLNAIQRVPDRIRIKPDQVGSRVNGCGLAAPAAWFGGRGARLAVPVRPVVLVAWLVRQWLDRRGAIHGSGAAGRRIGVENIRPGGGR